MEHSNLERVTIKAEPGAQEEDGDRTLNDEIDINLQDVKMECLEHSESHHKTTGKSKFPRY